MNCQHSTTRRTPLWRSFAPFGLALMLLTFLGMQRAQATTCAGATVLTYQNYTALSIVCGATDDITSANAPCGSSFYHGGQEAVYTFTSLGSGSASFAYNGVSWTGIFLYNGCPTSGGTCVANITSSATSKTLNATLTTGATYYLVIDTWPTPNSPCPGTITITVPPAASPCTGTPNPGNTTGPTGACTGTAFTLGLQNATTGTGVNYQWQFDSGSGWTNFGTNASTQSVTQTVATSYQCIVTCTGNGSTTSNPIAVPMNTFLNCYCVPTTTNGCLSGDHITNVTFGTINNNTGTCLSASYSDYTAISTSVGQTANVPISVSINNGGTEYGGAWIDYDHSGTFDASEFIVLNGGAGQGGGVFAGTASIPLTAQLGNTRLRVRSSYAAQVTSTSACNTYSYGETEDYLVNITTPPSCISPLVSNSNLGAHSIDINWTCSGCTGGYIVEYGLSGFTPGTGATAGVGGTIYSGAAVPAGPVTISGLSSSTTYTVYVRQECSAGSNYSANSSTSFTTQLDCATSPVLACSTPTSISMSGSGQWVPYNSCFCGYTTPGQERVWIFNAAIAGSYVLNVTTSSNTTYIDYWIKSSSAACDGNGWTFIRDFFGTGSQTFTIATPGQYYILADPESTVSVSQTFSIDCALPCATPTFPFAQNISSLAAQAAWTCNGCTGNSFTVEYGLSGFTLGTGTQVTSSSSPASITGLTPSTTYSAYVRQDCNNVGDGLSNWTPVFSFTTLPPPPPNDSCTQAIPIICGQSISGTNVGATIDGNPSQASGGNATVQNGVWYTYVGDDQQVTMSTCGGPFFDTRIHVYKGTCGALVGVAGNDDAGAACATSTTQSIVTFNAFSGNTYYIAVEGYSGTGSFTLTATCAPLCNPVVANDACVDAQVITMGTNCVQVGGNLSCATSSAGNNPACIGGFNTYPDAYYQFVATAPNAFVTVTGGANMYLVVYNGTSCITTSGTEFYCGAVTSGAPVLLTGLTTGNTYTVRIMELLANAATFSLCVQKLDVTDDPCAAVPLSCGDLRFGRTTGYLNNIPAGACPFNGAASTSGVNYFSYTAPADADVTFSTCGQTAFNTRISVFEGACTALTCSVMNDDAAGCPNNSSEVTVRAQAGSTYTVMVTGDGAANGNYQLSVFCEPWCSGSEANDRCANSSTITTYITGTGTPSTETQACSYADAPTSCSGASMVQGVWYDFNTGPNSVFDVYIGVNGTNPIYTAPAMNMTLFSGACSGVGASNEVLCQTNCNGTLNLPALTPNTTYRMLVYNTGGTNEGTFGLMVTHPGFRDAGVSTIAQPVGVVCDQKLFPQVYLHNYGEAPLTSAQIISRIDGGIVQTYAWSGPAIARGDSSLVSLPVITSPLGLHTYSAEVGTVNGGVDELATNNSSSSNYDASGQTIKVEVRTDNNPAQTSWVVYDAFFFPVAQSPLNMPANSVVTTTACLPTTFGNCFYFFLYDQAGDGLAGGGGWQLRDVLDRPVLQDNGTFNYQTPPSLPATTGYIAQEFCLPLGPTAPLSGECGVMNNILENKVFCNTVGGVVNYQFEFSDPNAGYRRRIGVPRNWVKFSEMQTNPLVFGTTYFCRVRVDQGASGFGDDYFGAGCEMALSPTQPICTELVSTAGPTLSCGVTKAFGGSDKIYAQPVSGATQYRFNFSNTGLGYSRTIVKPSYICLLSWVTQPLVSGNTYQVKVEAYVSGVWSGFCGATCPVTISNPHAQGAQLNSLEVEESTSTVALWPNPVRDGRFNLNLGGLTEEQQKVTVDIYDIFGKRVMAANYDNSGNTFQRTIDLPQGIAAGVYTVNITINGTVTTKRLTVQ